MQLIPLGLVQSNYVSVRKAREVIPRVERGTDLVRFFSISFLYLGQYTIYS